MAAALVLATMVAPQDATAATGQVVISGSGSGYVDLPYSLDAQRWSILGKGRYAGFYAVALDPRTGKPDPEDVGVGAVVLRDLKGPSGTTPEIGLGVPAPGVRGAVRLYLIADGPTTVTLFENDDKPVRKLRPTHRVRSTGRVTRLTSVSSVSERAPLTAPRESLSVAALMLTGPAAAADDVEVCITAPQATCTKRTLPMGPGREVESDPAAPSQTRLWSIGGRHVAGRYETVHAAHSPLWIDRALAATFSLQLA